MSGSADLDRDGRPDQWRATYQGGSGFGGYIVTLRLSSVAAPLTVDFFGSFGDFLGVALLPAALPRPVAVRAFRLLFGPGRQRRLAAPCAPRRPAGAPSPVPAPDGTFAWLAQWRSAADRPVTKPFLRRRSFRPRWTRGRPRLPRCQYALVGAALGRRLARILRPDEQAGDVAAAGSGDGGAIVTYYAHNQGALRRGAACGPWRLFVTRHAVAVHDPGADRHAWVFVSTGVRKLRWASLERVVCHARPGLVVLERRTHPGRELWVVRPRTGQLGQLPLSSDSKWHLDAARAVLHVGVRRYPLAALGRALQR